MKWLLPFAAALVAPATWMPAAPSPVNLVSDPSIETTTWQYSDSAGPVGPARSGAQAARIKREADRVQPSVTALVNDLKPSDYQLSAWFLPNMRETPDANFMAALDVDWLDAAGATVGHSQGPACNGRSKIWLYRETLVTAPAGTTSARLTFHFRTTSTGRCLLDDVALTAAEETAEVASTEVADLDFRSRDTLVGPGETIVLEGRNLPPELPAATLRAVVRDSAGRVVSEVEVPRPVSELSVDTGALPVGEWCSATVALIDGRGTVVARSSRIGLLVLPRPTDFVLKPSSPFAVLEGHPYQQRWIGARWARPNWNWNVREMELSRRYGVIQVGMINAATQALDGKMSIQEYAAFVAESVKRFKDFVTHWQLGNEPPLYQTGTVERYVKILRAGYEAAKRADPDCTVIMAGITGLNVDSEMIDKALAAGAGNCCDVIDVHLYVPVPEMDALLTRIRGDLAQHQVDKPLISTELTANLGSRLPDRNTAGYVYKRYAVGLSQGLAQIYWFVYRWPNPQVDFNYCGLVDNRTNEPRPAAAAYWQLAQALEDAEYVDRQVEPAGVWLFRFRREDKAVFVVWTESREPAPVALPTGAGEVTLIDVAGRRMTARTAGGFAVTATPEPLLVRAPWGRQVPDRLTTAGPAALRLTRGGAITVALRQPPAGPFRVDGPSALDVTAFNDGFRIEADAAAAPTDGTITILAASTAVRIPVTVTEAMSLDLRPAFIDDGPAVTATVVNHGAEATRYALRVTSPVTSGMRPKPWRHRAIDALPGGGTARVTLGLRAPPDPLGRYLFRLQGTFGDGVRGVLESGLVFCPAREFAEPPTIDGGLAEWGKGFPIEVDAMTGERSDPEDGPPTSDGDLSARAAVRWDRRHLYLAVEVRDDLHRNEQRDGALWDGDGIQFGLTPQPATAGAPFAEFGAALTRDGPQAWCWRNAAGRPTGPMSFPVAVRRSEERTVYELAVPWTSLPDLEPTAGAWYGFSLLVNEQDRAKRGFYGWHAGVGGDKDPSAYGQITLVSHGD